MSQGDIGTCDSCRKGFHYALIHNGFNDSAYSYCNSCGKTALLSGWFKNISKGAPLKLYERVSQELEPFLEPCECGGSFTTDAAPRCPNCREEISAIGAASYIERNAPGARAGWKWQQNWQGLYCIVIEKNVVQNNWKKSL